MQRNLKSSKNNGLDLSRLFYVFFVFLLFLIAFMGCVSSNGNSIQINNSANSSVPSVSNASNLSTSEDIDTQNLTNNISHDYQNYSEINQNTSSAGDITPNITKNTTSSTSGKNESKEYIVIDSGSRNAIYERKYVIVGLTQQWENLWKDMFPSSGTRPELPNVDFTKYDVLAIFAGSKKTGGYWLEPVGLREELGLVVFELKEHYPAPSCLVTQAFTQPYLIVGIPKSNKPIKVEFRLTQYEC